jgi:hypothetical protein
LYYIMLFHDIVNASHVAGQLSSIDVLCPWK